jgi:glycosyltransferase involved in cell wall biosynthesis
VHVVALVATYNEERFIAACLDHLLHQGVEVYVLDNDSTDATVSIAESNRSRGLLGIETMPRSDCYAWEPILRRKEALAGSIDADWFIHTDPDEFRLPARSHRTLREALDYVDRQGYNAVNFQEFTFVPTKDSPNHDHPHFQTTMQHYYPFLPRFPHRLNAWKRQPDRVDLHSSAGHCIRFSGLRMYPEAFPMRHYLFLSTAHAAEKYAHRTYARAEVQAGWHGWRAGFKPKNLVLPASSELRRYRSDSELDASNPWTCHYLDTAARSAAGYR